MLPWMNSKRKNENASFHMFDQKNEDLEEFRHVNITISVLGLTHGILMDSKKDEENSNGSVETNLRKCENSPIVAVVSGLKEASNTQCHLPSMPLKQTSISHSLKPRKYEFIALWPNIAGQEQSNLTFTRRIKRKKRRGGYSFSNERLILAVSLMRGYEIITLGQVSIPFSLCDEKVQIQLPIRTTVSHVQQAAAEMKGVKKRKDPMLRLSRNRFVKPLSFTDDPDRLFSFHRDSMLSVVVQTKVHCEMPMNDKLNEDRFHRERRDVHHFSRHDQKTNNVGESSNDIPLGTNTTFSSGEDSQSQCLTTFSSDEDSQSQCLIQDTFVGIEKDFGLSKQIQAEHKEQEEIDEAIDAKNQSTYYNSEEQIDRYCKQENDSAPYDASNPNFVHILHKSIPSNISSPTFSGCNNVQLHDSPKMMDMKNDGNDDNFFPTVRVESSCSDDYEEVEFEALDNFGFPSTSFSLNDQDDAMTTSSWTYNSWMSS